MNISNFILITLYLASLLTVHAEHCNCNCHAPADIIHRPKLYYPQIAPTYANGNHLGIHQSYHQLGGISHENIAYLTPAVITQVGQQHENIGRYGVAESLELENKLKSSATSLNYENTEQHQLYSNEDQRHLDTSHISNSAVTQQVKLSKVSSHQDSHYINIDQRISPHLDDHTAEQKDHHGKNDYYKFEYAVNDQKTHDIKLHKEEKKGDVVRGEYSLVEDDGNIRTVKYYADWKTGFHARVHNSKKTPLG